MSIEKNPKQHESKCPSCDTIFYPPNGLGLFCEKCLPKKIENLFPKKNKQKEVIKLESKTKGKSLLTAYIKPKDPLFFRNLVKQASEILDLALITFKENEVSIGGLDGTKVILYRIQMNRSAFEEYTIELGGEEKVEAVVSLHSLRKVLKRHPDGNGLEIRFNFKPYKGQKSETRINIESIGKVRKMFEIKQLEDFDPDYRPLNKKPKKLFEKLIVKAKLDLPFFFTCIDDSYAIGDRSITISAQKDTLRLRAEGLDGNAFSVDVLKGSQLLPFLEAKSTIIQSDFGIEKLEQIGKALYENKFPLFDQMFLSLGNHEPLYMRLTKDSIEVEILLAPRVDDDDYLEESDDYDDDDSEFDDD